LKHAAMKALTSSTSVLVTADDKFFNYSVQPSWIAIPKPCCCTEGYPENVDITGESLHNLEYPSIGRAAGLCGRRQS